MNDEQVIEQPVCGKIQGFIANPAPVMRRMQVFYQAEVVILLDVGDHTGRIAPPTTPIVLAPGTKPATQARRVADSGQRRQIPNGSAGSTFHPASKVGAKFRHPTRGSTGVPAMISWHSAIHSGGAGVIVTPQRALFVANTRPKVTRSSKRLDSTACRSVWLLSPHPSSRTCGPSASRSCGSRSCPSRHVATYMAEPNPDPSRATISNIGLQAEDRGRTSDFETNCARPTDWAALVVNVCIVKTAFGAL